MIFPTSCSIVATILLVERILQSKFSMAHVTGFTGYVVMRKVQVRKRPGDLHVDNRLHRHHVSFVRHDLCVILQSLNEIC